MTVKVGSGVSNTTGVEIFSEDAAFSAITVIATEVAMTAWSLAESVGELAG
ncbi:MAG TPA: hypothetical protein PKJ84_00065 [Anaerolineales bacterium]|nr:hypothetical protein [Anaerolineales bacterium]